MTDRTWASIIGGTIGAVVGGAALLWLGRRLSRG